MAFKVSMVLKPVLDVTVIVLCFALLAFIYKPGYFQVYQRGFFCDDHTIRYPFKPNTVPAVPFFVGTILVPVVLVLLVEIINAVLPGKPAYSPLPTDPDPSYCGSKRIPDFLCNLYKYIGIFLFGYSSLLICVCVLKLWAGRLRPYFLDVCQPDWTIIDCRSHQYIDPIPCTGNSSFAFEQARMSFPSGHAAQAYYTAIYIMFYYEFRGWKMCSHLIRPLLQVIVFLSASCIAITRVSDNWHHWTDVVAGSIIGMIFGVVFGIQKIAFKRKTIENTSIQNNYRPPQEADRVDHVRKTKHRYRMSALFDV